MPGRGRRVALMRKAMFAILIGAAFTILSLIVLPPAYCYQGLLCPFLIRDRGFPLTWLSEYGIPVSIPLIHPYAGGVEWRVDFGGLVSDLAVWSWFSFAGLLMAEEANRKHVMSLLSKHERLVGVVLGIATALTGLTGAFIVALPEGSFFAFFSFSLIGYFVLILGIVAAIASYTKSKGTIWIVCFEIGVLVTYATSFVQQTVPTLFGLTTRGLPIAWLTFGDGFALGTLLDVEGWIFLIDAVFWSSVFVALLLLVSVLQSGRLKS